MVVEGETTFAHLAHVRKSFPTHGLPNNFYTADLSLFDHVSRSTGLTPQAPQWPDILADYRL